MNQVFLEKYAELTVKTGINIQKDQILVVNSPIECSAFTRIIAEVAYKAGARDVVINWNDELFSRLDICMHLKRFLRNFLNGKEIITYPM